MVASLAIKAKGMTELIVPLPDDSGVKSPCRHAGDTGGVY
jgi:hypothetical protein